MDNFSNELDLSVFWCLRVVCLMPNQRLKNVKIMSMKDGSISLASFLFDTKYVLKTLPKNIYIGVGMKIIVDYRFFYFY